jgi:hypothetical protein
MSNTTITDEQRKAIIKLLKKGITIEQILDIYIEASGLIGVGLISLSDYLEKYVKAKIK